ncbi:PEP-utilizing family enzyme, partial [Muricomes intestini]
MITITGKSVFGGVSIGRLSFYKRKQRVIKRTHVDAVEAECARFQEAKTTAAGQLKELYEKALADVGEANAMIFEIHQMMLEDLDYIESVENIIRTQEVNAEFAVAATADNFAQMFTAMDDAYMQGRAADVKDVSERVLNILCGVDEGIKQTEEPSIIAADDLAPSETVQLDKSKVLGFATMYGSANSHTAILARTMNIPAIIGLGEELSDKLDGQMAVIDGFTGSLYIDPDEETLALMQEKRRE